MSEGSSMRTRAYALLVTLGCAKNEVDTDRMRALLERAGIVEVDTVEEADVVILNTCSFLASATQEGIEVTLQLAEQAAEGVRSVPIIMCGCIPSRYGAELPSELPEVAAFVPSDEEDGIADVVAEVLSLEPLSEGEPGLTPGGISDDVLPLRTVQGASAFVKVSEGCNRFCTFCAIPYIRGRYHSRPADEIVAEVRALAEGGVREVVLVGQDTGVWGSDLAEGESLAGLLRRVAEAMRPYHGWVRVLYLQPEGMTDELVSVFRDVDEVLPYIDIPIQHCSSEVLRRMGRKGSPAELAALFDRLRAEIPGIVIRTTAMAGFPGETDEEADELVSFLEDQGVDYCSVFSYSPEEGTRAAEMDGQVPDDVKLERTQRLVDLAEQMGFAATASHVGEEADVIIDGVEEGDDGPELVGHTWFQAPDTDGAVHIAEGEAAVGDVVRCRLTDAFCYELGGTIVEDGNDGSDE